MSKSTTDKTAPLNSVRLLKPHRHNNVDYAADAVIEVNDIERAWLQEQNIVATDAASTSQKED